MAYRPVRSWIANRIARYAVLPLLHRRQALQFEHRCRSARRVQTDLLANDWVVIAQMPAKAPQTAQEAPKHRGRPKGASRASKPAQRDSEAPYGRKADGTPRKPPGRRKVEVVMRAPAEQPAQ